MGMDIAYWICIGIIVLSGIHFLWTMADARCPECGSADLYWGKIWRCRSCGNVFLLARYID